MSWVHRCLIIPTEHAELARLLCETLAGPGGSGMFTTPLSPTAASPASHYISAGAVEEPFAQLLPLLTFPPDAEPLLLPGQPKLIAHLAEQQGMTVTVEQVQALLEASDVSEQEAFTAMARMGLQIVQPPGELFEASA